MGFLSIYQDKNLILFTVVTPSQTGYVSGYVLVTLDMYRS